MTSSDLKQKKPKTKDEYRLEEIDGEILLYSLSSTKSIYLNTSASIIWQFCTGEHTVAEIVAIVQENYPENTKEIERDIYETIEQFVENDAITLS